jgi:hypothetical protein
MRVLYWFRTPPGIKVGREPFDQEARKQIEAKNPGISFDWNAIASTPMPPVPDVEHWRERRRVERAAKVARREEEQESTRVEPESQGSADLSAAEPLVFAEATGLAEAGALALADAAVSLNGGSLDTVSDPPSADVPGAMAAPGAAATGDAPARKRRRRRGGRRRRTGADPAAGAATDLPDSEPQDSELDEPIESAGDDLSEPDVTLDPEPVPGPAQTAAETLVPTATPEQQSPSDLPADDRPDTSKE